MYLIFVLWFSIPAVVFANPVPHDLHNSKDLDITMQSLAVKRSDPDLDVYPTSNPNFSDNALFAANSIDQTDPASSSIVECPSDPSINEADDKTTKKRSIFPRGEACSSLESKPRLIDSHKKSPLSEPTQAEGSRESTQISNNPCTDKDRPHHVSCGGGFMADSERNCVPGLATSIEQRGVFRATDKLLQFCCREFLDQPWDWRADGCVELS